MAVEIFVRDMVIVLVAALLGGSVAKKSGYPAAMGELLVGVMIGPFAFGFVEYSESLVTFAEFGVIILLFYIGLETSIPMLKKYLVPSFVAAVAGALLPLGLGYYGALLLGLAQSEALFLGTVLTATSVGITTRMLSDLDRLNTKEGMTILGAGVVDDVAAVILLSIVASALAGKFTFLGLTDVLAKTAIFWTAAIVVGVYGLSRILDRLRIGTEALSLLLLAIGFAGAYLSAQLGLSTAIGAFAIGLALSNTIRSNEIVKSMQPIFLFFVPIFFVSIGMLIDPRAFVSSLVPGLLITGLAVLGKVLGCGGTLLFARYSVREAFTIGVGMIPRGEMGLIIAGIGLASGFIDAQTYLIAVMAVSSTTIIALPILKVLLVAGDLEADAKVSVRSIIKKASAEN